jgi:hypothetical protein
MNQFTPYSLGSQRGGVPVIVRARLPHPAWRGLVSHQLARVWELLWGPSQSYTGSSEQYQPLVRLWWCREWKRFSRNFPPMAVCNARHGRR